MDVLDVELVVEVGGSLAGPVTRVTDGAPLQASREAYITRWPVGLSLTRAKQ